MLSLQDPGAKPTRLGPVSEAGPLRCSLRHSLARVRPSGGEDVLHRRGPTAQHGFAQYRSGESEDGVDELAMGLATQRQEAANSRKKCGRLRTSLIMRIVGGTANIVTA